MDDAPDPVLKPLRIALAATALALLVTLFLVGLSSCRHSGFV